MGISVASRAHRTLRRLSRYRGIETMSDLVRGWFADLELKSQEAVIGLYENTPDSPQDAILFTTLGVYLRSGSGWDGFRYRDIVDVIFVGEKSLETDQLLVTLADDVEFVLPVRGGDREKGTKDWPEVGRFLMRVAEDVRAA